MLMTKYLGAWLCTYFLFIPINSAALGEGSNAFVMDNRAKDAKRALVLSMSNLC